MGSRFLPLAALCCGIVAFAGRAGADVIQDFEGSYSGPGTVITDPDDPSNHVLQLNNNQFAAFVTPGTTGVVTMNIYDYGVYVVTSGTVFGPRWGVSNSSDPTASDPSAAVDIVNGGGIVSNASYGMEVPAYLDKTTSWYSQAYYGPPRLAATLDDPSTAGVNEGVGEWTTWTFNVAANGDVTITNSRNGDNKVSGVYTNTGTVPAMSAIWLWGGSTDPSDYGLGVLVDDITFTSTAVPEPASVGLLAAGALVLLRRRRRG